MANLIQLGIDAVYNSLTNFNVSGIATQIIIAITLILVSFVLAAFVYFAARIAYELLLKKVIDKVPSKLYSEIFHHKLFSGLLYYLPTLVIYIILSVYLNEKNHLLILNKAVTIVIIFLTVRNVHLFMQLIEQIYKKQPFSFRMPIKGVLQIAITFVYIVGAILCLTTFLNMSPLVFLSGISAISAIILLIFKDSILGIVSGIQLIINNMIQIGDWIEVPEHHADGEVIDITMQTVRVRNWNKTIVSLPVYALVSHSFINWRGMQELKGRRIKRSISFDINSVKFCDNTTINHFKNFSLVKSYLEKKEQEIKKHNEQYKLNTKKDIVSSRAITNLGVFRAYVEAYLKQHPFISNTLTLMVRHLPPTDKGIPIEIYAFSNDIRWESYESIQADIFDHIMTSTKKFDLKIFQSPSGSDISQLIEKTK